MFIHCCIVHIYSSVSSFSWVACMEYIYVNCTLSAVKFMYKAACPHSGVLHASCTPRESWCSNKGESYCCCCWWWWCYYELIWWWWCFNDDDGDDEVYDGDHHHCGRNTDLFADFKSCCRCCWLEKYATAAAGPSRKLTKDDAAPISLIFPKC